MAKCGGCGKFLGATTDAAKCDKCRACYHRACVGILSKINIISPWHCPECKKNVARDNAPDTPVGSRYQVEQERSITESPNDSSYISMAQITQIVRSELAALKNEFVLCVRNEVQALRDDMVALKLSINNRMTNLEERIVALEKRDPMQPPDSSPMEKIITQLKCDLNDRDQELLANDIEIANLPEVIGENPVHTAMLIATKLGIQVEARDIVSAERVGGRRVSAAETALAPSARDSSPRQPRPRPLVVRLARRDLRDGMLQGARVRRGATTADLDVPGPPARFYVNERLTKTNRQLFRRARDVAAQRGWKYVWTKRGRILVRCKSSDVAHAVRFLKN